MFRAIDRRRVGRVLRHGGGPRTALAARSVLTARRLPAALPRSRLTSADPDTARSSAAAAVSASVPFPGASANSARSCATCGV